MLKRDDVTSSLSLRRFGVFFVLALILMPSYLSSAFGGPTSFVFTASGDYGKTKATTANLQLIARSGASFNLALGDLGYLSTWAGNETAWCNYVKSIVGPNFPFELVAGNHEDTTTENDGFIGKYAACLPDQMNSISYQAGYARQYFFDFPIVAPLARVIMIAAGLNIEGSGLYNYRLGGSNYTWLSNAIDGARAAGIPWVIVGMHFVCISAGVQSCSWPGGVDLMNLLLTKKVDLILQAHDHEYQRSKQLTCITVESYNPSCVSRDATDGFYVKGSGSAIVIPGIIGGGAFQAVNVTDPEYPYFARWEGSNNPNPFCGCAPGRGFVKYTISSTQLSGQFASLTTTAFTDSFTIMQGSPPLSAWFQRTPYFPTSGSPVTLTANQNGGLAPYSFSWDFGDGTKATGSVVKHTYLSPGVYPVTLNVTDATNQKTTVSQNVSVSKSGTPTSVILRPVGNGFSINWKKTANCSSNWACVADPVPDGDLTYVRTNLTGATDLYKIGNMITSGNRVIVGNLSYLIPSASTIQWVRFSLVARQTRISPSSYITAALGLGGGKVFGNLTSLTIFYSTYNQTWSVSPFSHSSWTIAQVSSLQAGQVYVLGTVTARVTEVYVEVRYVPH
jgi:PKD repeat protein